MKNVSPFHQGTLGVESQALQPRVGGETRRAERKGSERAFGVGGRPANLLGSF
jgi:hypothetical protein